MRHTNTAMHFYFKGFHQIHIITGPQDETALTTWDPFSGQRLEQHLASKVGSVAVLVPMVL